MREEIYAEHCYVLQYFVCAEGNVPVNHVIRKCEDFVCVEGNVPVNHVIRKCEDFVCGEGNVPVNHVIRKCEDFSRLCNCGTGRW